MRRRRPVNQSGGRPRLAGRPSFCILSALCARRWFYPNRAGKRSSVQKGDIRDGESLGCRRSAAAAAGASAVRVRTASAHSISHTRRAAAPCSPAPSSSSSFLRPRFTRQARQAASHTEPCFCNGGISYDIAARSTSFRSTASGPSTNLCAFQPISLSPTLTRVTPCAA